MSNGQPVFSTEVEHTVLANPGSPAEPQATALAAGQTDAAEDQGGPPTVSALGLAAAERSLIGTLARRHGNGLNPLVRAAEPLLDLIVPLRSHVGDMDVEALRLALVRAIKQFETDARAGEVDSQAIAIARYALCTLLDEAIAATPWGGGGVWARHSLLASFHDETWGGEKFFQLLQRLAQSPEDHLPVLELCYLCLALGFEGRYRVVDGGAAQLEALRERLQKIIQLHRGPQAAELSPHWKPAEGKPATLFQDVPVWWIAAFVGGIIVSVRIAFNYILDGRTEPLVERMHAISVRAQPTVRSAPPVATPATTVDAAPPGLAMQLAPEIAHGLVRLEEGKDEVAVVLLAGVFSSGSAEVSQLYRPVVERIGIALKSLEGTVLIVGHTDDQPSRQTQFHSNGELSLARAEAVMAVLAQQVGTPGRLQAEGRGDTEPLVPNISPENRARNRRVEILIRSQGGKP